MFNNYLILPHYNTKSVDNKVYFVEVLCFFCVRAKNIRNTWGAADRGNG